MVGDRADSYQPHWAHGGVQGGGMVGDRADAYQPHWTHGGQREGTFGEATSMNRSSCNADLYQLLWVQGGAQGEGTSGEATSMDRSSCHTDLYHSHWAHALPQTPYVIRYHEQREDTGGEIPVAR